MPNFNGYSVGQCNYIVVSQVLKNETYFLQLESAKLAGSGVNSLLAVEAH